MYEVLNSYINLEGIWKKWNLDVMMGDLTSLEILLGNIISNFVKRLGYLFYVMDPREHLFEHPKHVPDYYKEVTAAFIFVIVVEQFLHLVRGKKMMRLNDSVTNISQGILVELFKMPFIGTELLLYTYIYNNWRLYGLPWDSPWTWLFCMVGTDFCFYWMHRATHQISILWTFHEPHHSSEEFNLTTPLRLSIFTSYTLWLTYVPMAFIIPPSIFLVHYQLNVIFQYWLHSEYIPNLGVLEYIFVTPSHHRVHHGRNRRCIDKNFGSIFILWDRLFGTFEPEGDQPIKYGVTKPLQTFSPIHIQTNNFQAIWEKMKTVDGIFNKLSAIFKGPGWKPGSSWVGDLEDIPEPKEDEQKYDPVLPKWVELYVTIHTAVLVIGYLLMIVFLQKISTYTLMCCSLYIILTTISIGSLLDLSFSAPFLEILRCPLYFVLDSVLRKEFSSNNILLDFSMLGFRSLFLGSFVFWFYAAHFLRKNRR